MIKFQSIRVGPTLIKLPCGDRYLRSRDRFDISPEFRHCRIKFAHEYPDPRARLRFFPREFVLPSDRPSDGKITGIKVSEAVDVGRRTETEVASSIQRRFRELLGKTKLLHRVG